MAWTRIAQEFPDYPLADLPEMPAGCVDTSWHNDACPSISTANDTVRVFLDYVDPEKREVSIMTSRFCVFVAKDEFEEEIAYHGDDWQAVLAIISKQEG